MIDVLSRVFRLERGEWPKLIQFGLFGFLLQMGMGVGFSSGDAAFLSNVGADSLPLVFMLTPLVMLLYTVLFSYLLVRFTIDHMVDFTLASLIAGGAAFFALINVGLPPEWQTVLYFALKLYLAMWYIGLYSLFWNYTDAYFDIQDAKRLFPLFAAFCALGTASGALIVSLFASVVPMQYFFLLWAAIALLTAPLARLLRSRWRQIAENDADLDESSSSAVKQLAAVAGAFGKSRYTVVFTLTLFVMLLMTNLVEYQYSVVLQEGRSEGELAALFGTLYAAANLFNLVTCLFVFNRLVANLGVRNVAFIQPVTYFLVFGYFFLEGGTGAAIAGFFAYHGVLTSIEYNNENLLFNAVPSHVKRPLRTVVEGMAEPMASLVAGGFLLYAATQVDLRELSGIGVIVGAVLVAIVVLLRQLYPAAMADNMRQGWMNFGDRRLMEPQIAPEARALLEKEAASGTPAAQRAKRIVLSEQDAALQTSHELGVEELVALLSTEDARQREGVARALAQSASREDFHIVAPLAQRLPSLEQDERQEILRTLRGICDSESIPDILKAAGRLAPRERRAMANVLSSIGTTAIPRLIGGLLDEGLPYRTRSVAARALAEVSYAQFASQLDDLVRAELGQARKLQDDADVLDRYTRSTRHGALSLLARLQRERVGASLDFVLELLVLGGLLPNFDLLVVSLHSANAKVRGNAIEAIESGIGKDLFRMIEPMLRQDDQTTQSFHEIAETQIDAILADALASGQPIAMALAAHCLHDRLDARQFASQVHSVAGPDMPALVRAELMRLMKLEDDGSKPGALEILAALAAHPELGRAMLEALLALAEEAVTVLPAEAAIGSIARNTPFWVTHRTLRDVASRHPDLALVILKAQDHRQYAA